MSRGDRLTMKPGRYAITMTDYDHEAFGTLKPDGMHVLYGPGRPMIGPFRVRFVLCSRIKNPGTWPCYKREGHSGSCRLDPGGVAP